MAADMPVKAPVMRGPAPIAAYNWTGCYIGGHVGGLWARKQWEVREPLDPNFGLSDGSHNPNGWLGGVQGGCDYQFAGRFVIGIAGDYAWTDAEGSNASPLFPGWTNHSKVKNLASVTGRVGYAWDRFLGYVKGGVAWEKDEHRESLGGIIGTVSATRRGWTVGIGGEYAFTNYLSGFIEYDYYDFGREDLTFIFNNNGSFIFGIKETKSVVTGGLNLRWSAGAPVVARY